MSTKSWREDFEAMRAIAAAAASAEETPLATYPQRVSIEVRPSVYAAMLGARTDLTAVMRFAELLVEVCTDYVPGFDLDLMWQQAKEESK